MSYNPAVLITARRQFLANRQHTVTKPEAHRGPYPWGSVSAARAMILSRFDNHVFGFSVSNWVRRFVVRNLVISCDLIRHFLCPCTFHIRFIQINFA